MLSRITNPNIAFVLYPLFICYDTSRFEAVKELYDRLKDKPDETLCIIAIDEKEIIGFLVARKEKDHVFIWQAKATNKVPTAFVWEIIKQWAETFGFNKIRIKPTNDRLKKFYMRKYKFKDIGEEMQYEWRRTTEFK